MLQRQTRKRGDQPDSMGSEGINAKLDISINKMKIGFVLMSSKIKIRNI